MNFLRKSLTGLALALGLLSQGPAGATVTFSTTSDLVQDFNSSGYSRYVATSFVGTPFGAQSGSSWMVNDGVDSLHYSMNGFDVNGNPNDFYVANVSIGDGIAPGAGNSSDSFEFFNLSMDIGNTGSFADIVNSIYLRPVYTDVNDVLQTGQMTVKGVDADGVFSYSFTSDSLSFLKIVSDRNLQAVGLFNTSGDPLFVGTTYLLAAVNGAVSAPVPEPETWMLMLAGTAGMVLRSRRSQRAVSKVQKARTA